MLCITLCVAKIRTMESQMKSDILLCKVTDFACSFNHALKRCSLPNILSFHKKKLIQN